MEKSNMSRWVSFTANTTNNKDWTPVIIYMYNNLFLVVASVSNTSSYECKKQSNVSINFGLKANIIRLFRASIG